MAAYVAIQAPQPAGDDALLSALEKFVVPELFARRVGGGPLRVWVPGCATGELAYVIAGVLQARADLRDRPPDIQIFATDADEQAIATARLGIYPSARNDAYSPGWARYLRLADGNQVNTRWRDLITFAQHDLLADPPFAHLDLIVFDDWLSAYAEEAHEQILHTFHWCLRPRGYLVLGPGDSIGELQQLFAFGPLPGIFQRRSAPAFKPMVPQAIDLPAPDASAASLWPVLRQLQAMNLVLREKLREFARANNDLANLMDATGLATIFLDRALQIIRFTPQAQELFNLISADRGRPLAHISHTLDYAELLDDAARVLATLETTEREVRGAAGRWYLARLHPYRTAENRIEGVVLICMDITARVQAETELRRAQDDLERRVRERTEQLTSTNAQLELEAAKRMRLEDERTELLRKLVTSQEDERHRIARELHDQLGQSVSALGIGLGLLATPGVDPAQHKQTLARLQQIAAEIDQDMHRLAVDLRPTALDDLGLLPALQYYVERWSGQTGVQAEFQTVGLDKRLPRELESVLYRVVQEALTNVAKHAAARNVSIILEHRPDALRLIVEDDGRGFDLETLQQAPDVQRLGLLGIRERVTLVGGGLAIETALGGGTTLFVQLPAGGQVAVSG